MSEWTSVTRDEDLSDGDVSVVTPAGKEIAVARAEGRLYAFDDICTHEECQLSDGDIWEGEVTCPCHGSVFSLETGEVMNPPAEDPIEVYGVRVENGEIQLLI